MANVETVQNGMLAMLEPGETVEAAVFGASTAVLTGVLGILNIAKAATGSLESRGIVVTDRNVYLVKSGTLNANAVKEVLAKHPLVGLTLSRRGRWVLLNGEEVLCVTSNLGASGRDLEAVEQRIAAADSGGESPT